MYGGERGKRKIGQCFLSTSGKLQRINSEQTPSAPKVTASIVLVGCATAFANPSATVPLQHFEIHTV